MGYFPNGSSAEIFQATFCAHCVNWRHDEATDSYGCPIMDLHLFWNYDAVGADKDETKEAGLSMFIPKDCSGCKMFLPADPERCRDTPDMFEGAP